MTRVVLLLLVFSIISLSSLALKSPSSSSSSTTTTSTSSKTSTTSKLNYSNDDHKNKNFKSNNEIDIISSKDNINKGNSVNTMASLLSATSLVAGTTVGAGILALPSVAMKPGMLYSSIALIGAWLYMASTGMLIAEVSCNLVAKDSSNKDFGILALTKNIIGSKEATVAGLVYLFIHYALLIAYIAEAGDVLNQAFNLPYQYMGPILFTSIIGSIVTFGSSTLVEQTNNFFVVIVLASFAALVSIGLPLVKYSNLLHGDVTELVSTIPVMLVALVYHNVVPSICSLLKYDKQSIQKAIVFGSFLPLIMFLTWNFVILGIGNAGGMDSPLVAQFISIFSEAAIITSFLGFVIGLMSFYKDVFPNKNDRDLSLYGLVLLPPFAVAIYNPNIFLNALNLAGTFGITLLFGALPCFLSWRLRSKISDPQQGFTYQNFVPGGNNSLIIILLLTGFVIVQKFI